MQLEFLKVELGTALLNTLKAAASVQEASDAVLLQYERPADQSQEAKDKRAAYGQEFFRKYGSSVYFRTECRASIASSSVISVSLYSSFLVRLPRDRWLWFLAPVYL